MSSSTPKILLKSLINPKTLQNGEFPQKLTEKLEKYFNSKVFVLNSGRSAIFVALKALGLGQGDEVIIQAYTCNAVPNPVLWTGAIPVYVDIDEDTLNMDLTDLESKISPRTKAIIVQHTFGSPAKIKEILKIADKHDIKVIEDCAHSFGAKLEERLLGTFGDMAIVSFGREKVVSSLTGGALIVNNPALLEHVSSEVRSLKPLPMRRILNEIGNYFSWRLVFRKLLSKNWGVNFVHYLHQFDFVNVVTSQKELSGQKPSWYPGSLPNVFAHIAFEELDKVEEFNLRREEIAKTYFEKALPEGLKILPPHQGIYLRIVAFHPKAKKIVIEGKKEKLAFGNWYDSVIYPETAHLSKLGYASGTCPVAEKISKETLNLPNYLGISEQEIDRSLEFIKKFR